MCLVVLQRLEKHTCWPRSILVSSTRLHFLLPCCPPPAGADVSMRPSGSAMVGSSEWAHGRWRRHWQVGACASGRALASEHGCMGKGSSGKSGRERKICDVKSLLPCPLWDGIITSGWSAQPAVITCFHRQLRDGPNGETIFHRRQADDKSLLVQRLPSDLPLYHLVITISYIAHQSGGS